MILAELRRALQISETRAEEITKEVIEMKGKQKSRTYTILYMV